MSLSPIKKLLLTYTPNQTQESCDLRVIVSGIFIENNIPPLTVEEKVFLRGDMIVFSSCTSVRAYEVYRFQKKLIQEITKKNKPKNPITGVRFL